MALSVYEKNQICKSQFQDLLASLSSLEYEPTIQTAKGQFQDEFDKYSIWADSHGANHPPNSSRSLDHRLRFASPYKDEIIRILDILASQLQVDAAKWLGIPSESYELTQRIERDIADAASDCESVWEVSSESESDNELKAFPPRSGKDVTVNSAAKRLLEATQVAIKCLYRVPLRKPAPMDRLKDKFVENRKPLPHTIYDQLYISDKFPTLHAVVQKRLARMITRRRELLNYRRHHSEKLALKPDGLDDAEESKDTIPHTAVVDNNGKFAGPNDNDDTGTRSGGGAVTQYTKATTVRIDPESLPMLQVFAEGFVQNQPSRISNLPEDDARTSVAGSRATREIAIEVPPRPK